MLKLIKCETKDVWLFTFGKPESCMAERGQSLSYIQCSCQEVMAARRILPGVDQGAQAFGQSSKKDHEYGQAKIKGSGT